MISKTMIKMKKVLAFALCYTLIAGLVPYGANADEAGSANASSDASAEATTAASGDATTETATTEDASSEANEKVLGAGIGYALLDGESLDIDFAAAGAYYIPITFAEKGYLTVERTDASKDAVVNVSILNVSKDAISAGDTLEASDSTEQIELKAGTYYIKLTSETPAVITVKASYAAGLIFKTGRKNKYSLGKHKASTAFYLQYKATKTGYFSIENMIKNKINVTLLSDSKKAYTKVISIAAYSSKNHKNKKNIAGFGVIKGNVYIVKVTAPKSVKKLTLKGAIKAYSTLGGTALGNKAMKLKNKKTYKATLEPLAKSGKARYYTFKKTSSKDITIHVSTKGLKNQGSMKFYLYYKEAVGAKKGKILPVKIGGKHFGFSQKADKLSDMKIPSNWPNRTYYLKVYNTSKSTGCYTIKCS